MSSQKVNVITDETLELLTQHCDELGVFNENCAFLCTAFAAMMEFDCEFDETTARGVDNYARDIKEQAEKIKEQAEKIKGEVLIR